MTCRAAVPANPAKPAKPANQDLDRAYRASQAFRARRMTEESVVGRYLKCWRRPHMPTEEEARKALRDLGIADHYDIDRCRTCGWWIWNRRPDHSDAK